MKKLLLLSIMLMLVMLGIQGVGAEEIIVEEVVEPSSFDNWVAVMTDFASLKNFVLTSSGVAALVSLAKIRSAYKFLKSAKGLAAIENMFVKVIGKITDKPEMVVKIVKIIATMPVVSKILAKFEAQANIYELELQGKILDYESKISAKIFEGDKLDEATSYLASLREEYENLKSI